MKQISILGCGWLGLPLAKSLVEKGFMVKGSTTSESKMETLQQEGILPFQIVLGEDKMEGDITAFLENSEILLIDIPPKLRGNQPENFVSKIKTLLPFIGEAKIKKVLFVSSTSVFADDNAIVTESTKPNPPTESGKQLLVAEQLLQNQANFQTTIVRFGGLIGENRHPIYFLAGRKGIENPEAPINFIHQKDCISLIEAIIEKDFWNETLHGVAPQHPSRKAYYTKKAQELQLPLPEFEDTKPSVGKTVASEKVPHFLPYEYQTAID